MTRVSVVGTVHNDLGSANATSLYALLRQLEPNVVFLEQPADGFETFCTSTSKTIEAIAACHYRQTHQATLVPVDIPQSALISRSQIHTMFAAIGQHSPELKHMEAVQDQYTGDFGFAFLNSQDNLTLSRAIRAAELAAVEGLNSRDITETFRQWTEMHSQREMGMKRNIELYCRSHAIDRAVFLVGSEHRPSFLDMTLGHRLEGGSDLLWDFPGLGDGS